MYCEITDLQQWDPTSYWARLKEIAPPSGLLAQFSPSCSYTHIEEDCYSLYTSLSLHIGDKVWASELKKLDLQTLEECINRIFQSKCFANQK